ncbi:PREDICTED: uncharacterized protein LOC109242178 [Nicotiana attenuata]|uniref:uncharacterized protein LOC109242178 n=1 Tax=Nicotiana attenuata TaxID=49451 RepID=UPI0009046E4B|nr:PREDICTED: uncharacterized protein LOC109242178 [Nicotiana attenuata]
MDFCEMVIDMIWRTMSNNWYSVIVNGTRFGFFHSSRGLKQGDPLSSSLFIIGAELLSRMLNTLNHSQLFNGFYMERRGPQVNHLSFADDIMIFSSGGRSSLQRIMWILNNYEKTPGQQINRQKSHFMSSPCAFQSTVRRIQTVTGFTKKTSPLTCLGCPLYRGRSRISHFNSLTSKIVGRIRGWHGKKQIEKIAANFFWGMENNRRKYHWASWHKLCFPVKEGGLGFRTIADTCKCMELKRWWHFRTAQSLWSSFLRAKYCQRSNPISKKWVSGQSQAWKRMMFNKKEAEKNIRWRLHSGNCSFWWDNWLGSGPLSHHRNEGGRPGNVQVSNFWTEAIWTPNANGKFTCASAWEVIRNRKQPNFTNKMTWHKKIPFKWSFCLWRALRNKLPTDDRVLPFSSPTGTRCVCCSFHTSETVDHLFSMGKFARIVWGRFSGLVGVQTEQIPLRLLLMKWWCLKSHNEVQNSFFTPFPSSSVGTFGRTDAELYPLIERLEHQTLSTQVIWEKPIPGFVKINSDGSALTNPGKIGAGVIVRDHDCTFIHAIAAPIGEGTNNYAETEAAILGIQLCLNNGFTKVHLETDSAPFFTTRIRNTTDCSQHKNLQSAIPHKPEIPPKPLPPNSFPEHTRTWNLKAPFLTCLLCLQVHCVDLGNLCTLSQWY